MIKEATTKKKKTQTNMQKKNPDQKELITTRNIQSNILIDDKIKNDGIKNRNEAKLKGET